MCAESVSVLMPIGRADEFVAPAIQSVLSQLSVDVELIVVGPAQSPTHTTAHTTTQTAPSPSHSFNALNELLNAQFANDSRIRLIQRNSPGIVAALNTALQHTSCAYIARMDADDIAEPARFVQQLAVSQQYDHRCLVSGCVSIFSSQHEVLSGNQHYQRWLNEQRSPDAIRKACFIESPLPHPTWFAHKSVWKRIGAYQQGDFPEDYDMVLRAWLLGIPMAKPEGSLLHWREHETRLTRTDPRYRREAFIHLKAAALADARSGLGVREGRPIWIAGTGRNARYWHDALESNNARVVGFIDLDGPNAKQQKRHKPVMSYQHYIENRGTDLLVTAITAPDAREKLKLWCDEQDLCIGKDVVLGG